MADFRLRIGFAKTGAAIWLSHLEVVRAMERCVRRSGLPCAISQGFSPHMKHSFTAALPVGTGSTGEYMDVELVSLIDLEQALGALRAAQHEYLPVLSTTYAPKDEPSLQVYFNQADYRIELEDYSGTLASDLCERLSARPQITVIKKNKPKAYDLNHYVVDVTVDQDNSNTINLSLLSLPEGSLRPEVILEAIAKPDFEPRITGITRIALKHKDLPTLT